MPVTKMKQPDPSFYKTFLHVSSTWLSFHFRGTLSSVPARLFVSGQRSAIFIVHHFCQSLFYIWIKRRASNKRGRVKMNTGYTQSNLK